MKCRKLTVQNLKPGSPWPVMECGGAYVDNGDTIIVDERIAKRFATQYIGHLVDAGECEMESLSGGHYQIEKAGKTDGGDPKPKSEPKPPPADETPTTDESPADKADDRSMEGRGRRGKKKKTKTK